MLKKKLVLSPSKSQDLSNPLTLEISLSPFNRTAFIRTLSEASKGT
uniref:Uncharacterized protein n=1 Tax=Coprothermobacter proteolyticus (strain ATCC 35245 / DSM 5265 / OCM 4 / BT) TaxID=309798 RepID=B5Y5Z1_COPPD